MTKTTILIVEDNDAIRESTAEILELAGYLVLTAADGKAGFDLAIRQLPDVILCDIMMPVLDGYGMLYLLGKNVQTANIPFIFLTAKAEGADFRKGMEMGADDYLTKPFDDVQLLNAIDVRLKKKHQVHISVGETHHNLPEEAQQDLLNHLTGRLKKVKKKQHIYQESDTPQYVYRIKSGKVRSYLHYPDGRQLFTAIYSTDEYFGYEAILLQQKYSDNTEALETAELELINKNDFFELLYLKPAITRKFIRLLAANIREKEQQLLRLAYHSVRKRVADALVIISHKFTDNPANDERLVTISREDLAAMTGTANQTISRTLAEFKDEGLISRTENGILLHSIKKLKHLKQ